MQEDIFGNTTYNATGTAHETVSQIAFRWQTAAILFITLSAGFGNFAMVLVLWFTGRYKPVANRFFMSSVIACDTLIALMIAPPSLISSVYGKWAYSEALCHVEGALFCILWIASLYSLAFLNFDHFMAIAYPNHYKSFQVGCSSLRSATATYLQSIAISPVTVASCFLVVADAVTEHSVVADDQQLIISFALSKTSKRLAFFQICDRAHVHVGLLQEVLLCFLFQNNKMRSICWLFVFWLSAVGFCAPIFLHQLQSRFDPHTYLCQVDWSHKTLGYLTAAFMTTIFPAVIVLVVGSVYVLTDDYKRNKRSTVNANNRFSRRPLVYEVNCLFGLVFVTCWLPYLVLKFLLVVGNVSLRRIDDMYWLHFLFVWTGMSNCCSKFFLWTKLSYVFRRGLKSVYRQLTCKVRSYQPRMVRTRHRRRTSVWQTVGQQRI